MPRDAVSRTANVGTVGTNGLIGGNEMIMLNQVIGSNDVLIGYRQYEENPVYPPMGKHDTAFFRSLARW